MRVANAPATEGDRQARGRETLAKLCTCSARDRRFRLPAIALEHSLEQSNFTDASHDNLTDSHAQSSIIHVYVLFLGIA